MGKPSDQDAIAPGSSGPSTSLTGPSSSINLGTSPPPVFPPPSQRYFDEDPAEFLQDDLPPLYEDIDREDNNNDNDNDARARLIDNPVPVVSPYVRDTGLTIVPFHRDAKTETAYYINEDLETDPSKLENALKSLAKMPPRPFAVIRGTHTERHQSRNRNDNREESRQVVDFDIEIEMTHLFFADIQNMHLQMGGTTGTLGRLKSVGNFEKVKRGTVFATRAPGFGGGGGAVENGEPTVQEWCHRFCASSAGLKNLSFERRAVGYDWEYLTRRLQDAVRATNYRGRLDVSFPVRNSRVEIYNSCRTNRWRLTRWIFYLAVFTLTFLLTWPWLFFRTKKWETIYTEWELSREEMDNSTGVKRRKYTTMSEEEWLSMWFSAVQTAVLERRQGQLNQGDLGRGMGMGGVPGTMDISEAVRGESARRTHSIVETMGVMNRWFGWGGDHEV